MASAWCARTVGTKPTEQKRDMAKPGLKLGAIVTCQKCGGNYYVPPSRVGKSHYCSKRCYDAVRQTGERKVCRDFGAPKPEWKECPICGIKFWATKSSRKTSDGLRIYCSTKCSKQMRRGSMRTCLCCGKEFYIAPAKARQRNSGNCCSAECQKQHYTNERAAQWKGGRYLDKHTRTIRVRLERDGFASKYVAEHRVVASRIIGRMLETYEPIIHINNITTDNRPANLFICRTIAELRKRWHGVWPWPQRSNLDRYR